MWFLVGYISKHIVDVYKVVRLSSNCYVASIVFSLLYHYPIGRIRFVNLWEGPASRD